MPIFIVSFQTPTETSTRKEETKVQRFSGPFRCSRRYTRHEGFRRIQKNKYRARNSSVDDQKAERPRRASTRHNCEPREAFAAPTRREYEVPTKTEDQREILKDSGHSSSKRRVEVECQNRDSLKEDVCSCLASTKTFPRSLTIQEETRRCHSYFIRMISRTSSESDSSCNRVSNATDSVKGLISSKSF